MNKSIFKILFILTLSFCTYGVRAQSAIDEVVTGIRTSNVHDFAKYLDNIVLVTIDNIQFTHSRAQTELVLKDFFRKNPPEDIMVVSSGSSDNASKFVICNLTAGSSKYIVYIQTRQKDNGPAIVEEIRLNKQ